MSKKAKTFGAIVSIILYVACIAFIVVSLIKEISFDSCKTISLLIGAIGLTDLIVFILNFGYLKPLRIPAGVISFLISALAIIFLLFDIDPKAVTNTFAIIDIVSAFLLSSFSIIGIRKRFDFIGLLISIGNLVFGILLLIEGPKGIPVHLIFEAVAMALLIINLILDLKKLNKSR